MNGTMTERGQKNKLSTCLVYLVSILFIREGLLSRHAFFSNALLHILRHTPQLEPRQKTAYPPQLPLDRLWVKCLAQGHVSSSCRGLGMRREDK